MTTVSTLGNLITAQFTDPGAANQPLIRRRDRQLTSTCRWRPTRRGRSRARPTRRRGDQREPGCVRRLSPPRPIGITRSRAPRSCNRRLSCTLSDFLFAPQPGSPSDPPGYEVQRAPFTPHVLASAPSAMGRRWASSSTRDSRPTPGPERSPPSRPPSDSSGTTPPTRPPTPWSTSSTSSSCRRPTRTA